jgi:hypothetical protein
VTSADPTEGVTRLSRSARRRAEPGEAGRLPAHLVYDQRLITDELIEERYAGRQLTGVAAAMAAMGASFYRRDSYEEGMLWREAHRLRHSTLLIWGREDRVNPLDGALVPLKLLRNCQLHVFGGCGHWAQLEKFDEFNRSPSTSWRATGKQQAKGRHDEHPIAGVLADRECQARRVARLGLRCSAWWRAAVTRPALFTCGWTTSRPGW